METLPTTTIQYGKKEYEVPYNIYLITRDTGEKLKSECLKRDERRKLIKSFHDIKRHRKLVEYLIDKKSTFNRFIKYTYKKITTTKKHYIYLESFILSKGFLSYVIQTEDKIKHLFKRYEKVKKVKYIIPNTDKVFDYNITRQNNKIKKTFKDGIYYGIEVINSEEEQEIVDIKILNSRLYIKNNKMKRYMFKNNCLWLCEYEIVIKNDFEDFKKCLSECFEDVNTSNNTWREYIDSRFEKMLKYFNNENNLEDMQKEYDAVRIAKLKQIQNG